MQAPTEIASLVERFERSREAYLSQHYNETQLRREFLDPFFTTLGWDVENRKGYAEAYKDVIHEDAVKIGTATKAPDYSFRIGGVRKFFVEAKKPAVNLNEDVSPAYQVRRYAWSAKLPLSILTDFEEFAVYDCRIKPNPNDRPSTGRVQYLRYTDYLSRWEEIASVFSREAVLKGSFDKYVESKKGKRGTAEVDDAFLQDIEAWRYMLARVIALRNERVSVRDLNFAVQRTIDRIIFLRICEDRGIETYGTLMALQNGEHVYKRLCELFYRADEKYNSGLFHFQKEKNRREPPDEFTTSLVVDDQVLKDLIGGLYYPVSPYEFSVLPADILGQVYEQFLGKVIRLTAGHRAVVEDKPEVKKAGGVYYTPTYIVEYIVKNTVGKLLGSDPTPGPSPRRRGVSAAGGRGEVTRPMTPKQVSRLRILDPACGSGSFLIGAYQYLLDWHRDWYMNDGPEKWAKGKNPTLYQTGESTSPTFPGIDEAKGGAGGGSWRLTTAERKRILLSNIYGVDIDPQAVEVTKLSLLLKVLEGENEQTISRQLRMFHERALPDLGSNIKCGNSLIGPDFYDGQQLSLMDDEERLRINAFDWQREFPQVFPPSPHLRGEGRGGVGFDAVIGNPPWGAEFSLIEQSYIRRAYKLGQASTLDSYALFVERSLSRLRKNGLLGFITPDTFLRKGDYLELRRLFLDSSTVHELVETGPLFSQVRDTWCLVFTIGRRPPDGTATILHRKLSRFIVSVEERLSKFGRDEWDAESVVPQSVWRDRPGLIVGYRTSESEQALIKKLEEHPRLGEQVSRFRVSRGEEGSKFKLKETPMGEFSMITPAEVDRYSVGNGIRVSTKSLTASKVEGLYSHPKIWIIRIQKMRWRQRVVCSFDHRRDTAGMKTLQIIVSPNDSEQELKYLTALLASRLMNFWCTNYLADDMNQSYLEKLPIHTINFSDPADKARHDRMVELVQVMLDLNKKLPSARTDHERTAIQRQIDATDRQIDELVYELYSLTDEEKKIVEGNTPENR
jgi:hypothetical protein